MRLRREDEVMKTLIAMMALVVVSGVAEAGKSRRTPTTPTTTTTTTTTTVPPAPVVALASVKIRVDADGLYTVTATQMAASLGITTAQATSYIQNKQVRITNMGMDVALLAGSGSASLHFFGEGIKNRFGGGNVYWLQAGVAGMVMKSSTGTAPAANTAAISFTDTVHAEESRYGVTTLFSDVNADFWVWDFAFAPDAQYGRRTFTVNVPKVAASTATASVKVALIGGADSSLPADNQARLYLNGTLIGQGAWDGYAAYTLAGTCAQSLLREGANTVEVECIVPVGAPYGCFYIDAIDVTYRKAFAAVANTALVKGDGNTVVTVRGFSNADIKVINLANPRSPVVVAATKIDSDTAGYRASFKPASATTEYLVVALSSASTAAASVDAASNLTSAGNAADYLVIAPASLAAAAGELAAHRVTQGLSAKVVTVEDIFDEFNYGLRDPLAIKAFLAYTQTTWTGKPRYVVLAGQGSYDYANALGNGDSLVPPLMMSTPYGLVESDTLLADTDDNGVPNLAIGRLPVRTASELQAVIAKIRAYEQGGAWKNTVQMVADNDDGSGSYTFECDLAAQSVKADYVSKAYLLQQPLADVRAATMGALNAGCAVVNYVGHGLTTQLAQEGILTQGDVAVLANGANAPVVLAMACYAGQFGMPGADSVAEAMVVKANGGAVAVWAAADQAYASESRILNAGFYQSLSAATPRIGDAIRGALTKYAAEGHMTYIRYMYNLMGDPATIAGENM